jgi:hypothetical protein
MPPSTLFELAAVLALYGADKPRSRQTSLGPSELGTPCSQQIARKIAGHKRRVETKPPWATLTGGAVHDLMEDVLGYWNKIEVRDTGDRWIAEGELSDGMDVTGHSDAYDVEHQMVIDWKYTDFQAKKLREAKKAGVEVRDQVSQDYRIQAHLYGYMQNLAGREVKWVRIVFFGRTADLLRDSEEWTEVFNPEIGIWALDRYYSLVDHVNGPEVNPHSLDVRDAQVLAVSTAPDQHTCGWCPFFVPQSTPSAAGCPGHTTPKQAFVAEQLHLAFGQ